MSKKLTATSLAAAAVPLLALLADLDWKTQVIVGAIVVTYLIVQGIVDAREAARPQSDAEIEARGEAARMRRERDEERTARKAWQKKAGELEQLAEARKQHILKIDPDAYEPKPKP